MPEISRLLGIIIAIYYNEHNPTGADFAPEFLYKKLRPDASRASGAQKTRAV